MFADINEAAYFQYRPIAGIEDATALCLIDFPCEPLLGFDMVMASHSLMTTPSPGSSLREPLIPLRNILSRPGGCCAAKGNGNIIPQKFESFFPVLLQKIAAPDSDKAGKAPENAECFFLLSGAIVS